MVLLMFSLVFSTLPYYPNHFTRGQQLLTYRFWTGTAVNDQTSTKLKEALKRKSEPSQRQHIVLPHDLPKLNSLLQHILSSCIVAMSALVT